jgi:hypothetical protein
MNTSEETMGDVHYFIEIEIDSPECELVKSMFDVWSGLCIRAIETGNLTILLSLRFVDLQELDDVNVKQFQRSIIFCFFYNLRCFFLLFLFGEVLSFYLIHHSPGY